MTYLYAVTIVALLVSLGRSCGNTLNALSLALRRRLNILPAFDTMMVLFSITITLLPEEWVASSVGQGSGYLGVTIAAGISSIVFMPGFIAFPLSGELLRQDIPYMVLAAFTTTLMMVGVVTFILLRKRMSDVRWLIVDRKGWALGQFNNHRSHFKHR